MFRVEPKDFINYFNSIGLIDFTDFTAKHAVQALKMSDPTRSLIVSSKVSFQDEISEIIPASRSTFLQGIVQITLGRKMTTDNYYANEDASVAEQLREVFRDYILPTQDRNPDFELFREETLQKEEVDRVIKYYHSLLEECWNFLAGLREVEGAEGVGMRLWAFLLMIAGLVESKPPFFKIVKQSFLHSQKVVEDEERSVEHKVLNFLEFYEAIVRFSYCYAEECSPLKGHAGLIHCTDAITRVVNPHAVGHWQTSELTEAAKSVIAGRRTPWSFSDNR